MLQTGVRTIRRDIAQLRAAGHWVPTRGVVHDTGRGQSHKAKIVEMYLRRMTYSQIAKRARHSPEAIKRYVQISVGCWWRERADCWLRARLRLWWE